MLAHITVPFAYHCQTTGWEGSCIESVAAAHLCLEAKVGASCVARACHVAAQVLLSVVRKVDEQGLPVRAWGR